MKPMLSPCAQCPWRKSNQGKPHPDGWYSKANLLRLWNGLRSGDAPGMTCHPTDPTNPLPEGWKEVPKETERRECAGSLILIIRELKVLEKEQENYRKISPGRRGLTPEGIAHWVLGRIKFAGTIMGTGTAIPNIADDQDVCRPMPKEKVASVT